MHGAVGRDVSDLAPLPGGAQFVLASGYPYEFPTFSIATLCATGFAYAASTYPTTVAVTPQRGGLVAGGTSSAYGPDIRLYRTGEATPSREIEIGSRDMGRRLAFSPDGTWLYGLATRYPTGPTSSSSRWPTPTCRR
ncbi:MAG: hypothetical protein HC863_01215 [Myxococcales bacterium]|nr:hypothetical protein [Myxococcales bacterium]